ncbi:MAG TPA: hypothetical protein VNO35_27565 [Steroidobacteraceae bacterium]|nr:hypothetical protein [Steroidobacteraceae bacterium]
MTTTLWLRISAAVAMLLAIGHTLGGRKYWSPMGENPVLQAMRDSHFDVMGASRSYFDFYMAFGYSLSVALVMQAILLWQLAGLASAQPARVRGMVTAIAVAVVVSGVIAWRLIFPVPALFSLVLAACLVAALLKTRG